MLFMMTMRLMCDDGVDDGGDNVDVVVGFSNCNDNACW